MKYSVLMSVYAKDSPVYLDLALKSLVEQTHFVQQVVLVEDGQIPYELTVVINQYRSKINICIVKLAQNSGLGAALNEGLKYCTHELVARMDSDDICLPTRFKRQVTMFEDNPELSVLGSSAVEVDSFGHRGDVRSMPITHDDIMSSMWACPFLHPTVMFRRSKILALGGYDESLRRRQDYELWFRCAKAGYVFANIPEPLLLYRFDRLTHIKQSVPLALEQAIIGFKGTSLNNMELWKRFGCFIPFFRSLLPLSLQHFVYRYLKKFDPRN